MIRTFTSESVTSGHPDKLCDLIADSILDACLEQDKNSRVACEVMLSFNKCFIAGEITTNAKVDYIEVAKNVIKNVGFDPNKLEYEIRINKQSPDIAQAVDKSELGAGDQSIVYGYANRESNEYMPLSIVLANRLTRRLEECRKLNIIKGLLPDGKALVAINYIDEKDFKNIATILVSAQHIESKDIVELRKEIKKYVIDYVFEDYNLNETSILINPSGRFVLGSFEADTGLTNRKLMVDSYGSRSHHGGGGYCGKDATKVDRSGAYLARYIAKNIVASHLAIECEVTLTYSIGLSKPTNVDINTFGTGYKNDDFLKEVVLKAFDLKVGSLIDYLDLKKPIFAKTSTNGHFGHSYFPWERVDKIKDLKNAVNKVQGYEQLSLFGDEDP